MHLNELCKTCLSIFYGLYFICDMPPWTLKLTSLPTTAPHNNDFNVHCIVRRTSLMSTKHNGVTVQSKMKVQDFA